MSSQYHIISLDNDYGCIDNLTLYSSHDTKQEAEEALKVVGQACRKSHVDKAKREKENYQRY